MERNNLAQMLEGLKTEWRSIPYTWRDVALYALAVGAGPEEMCYLYEKDMKMLPTFGVLPYWSAVNVSSRFPRPYALPVVAQEILKPEKSFVNLDYELRIHRPMDPIKGSMVYRDVFEGLYDRGEGRGAALRSQLEVFDEAGNLMCSNRCTTLFPTLGGFGGQPLPKEQVRMPNRAPDSVATDYVSPVQHMLYRLTGDTNLVHCDQKAAEEQGLKGPFVQALCAFGYACRLAILKLFPGQPQRVTRIAAKVKGNLYPDTNIQLHLWQQEEGQAVFRLVDADHHVTLLDWGVFEWQ